MAPLAAHGRARRRTLYLLLTVLSLLAPVQASASGAPASAGQALRQPPQAQIASALDLAGENALPAGYPALVGAPMVPPVLLKAIAWVESSWRQFRAPDEPLMSPGGGYGVMQITHGLGGIPISDTVQSAIANNFIYNIACGAQLLASKWVATPPIGGGDPSVIEDWYYALWAYNDWGWRNNPNNPAFKRTGTPATNPRGFPYQERVLYFVSHPPRDTSGQPLWTAVPVTLPAAKAIGKKPGPLPAPATPHRDAAPADGPLLVSGDEAAQLLADSAPPDGSAVAPATPVHKVWLLRNTGGTFWSGYTWRFVGGDQMGAPISTTVPLVPPLADVALAADLVAPAASGPYQGYWQLFDAQARPVGERAAVALTVTAALSETLAPATAATAASPLPTDGPASAGSLPVATAPPTAAALRTRLQAIDNAAYVADLTIPDGTVLAPGQGFVKTWEIKNTGTRAWDSRYHWTFEAGAPLGTVHAIPAPRVPPGGTAVFSVQMVTPARAGSYRGFWQMTDPSGTVFGTQAWVSVRVASPATATPRPTPTVPATATAARATATSTHVPPATAPAPPTAGTTPAAPTPVPWFGPAVGHAFFAEGYTGDGYHEYLSLLNPQRSVMRAQLTIYRADGATRWLALRLAPLALRTVDLNALAPGASTALTVAADGDAVVERALFTANGHVVAGAPLPGRRWYVAEAYVGAGFRDGLRIFNPYDAAADVTIKAYRADGSVLLSHRLVRGGTRLNVALDDVAPIGSSGLEVDSAEPVVVESVVQSPGAAGPSAAMALTAPSRRWYFPDGGTSRGNEEYIALLNPGDATATVRLYPVTDDGYLRPIALRVAPHARAVYVVHSHVRRAGLAAALESDQPIVAQEVRYTSTGAVSVVNGASGPARAWGLAEGYVGSGFKEWITLLNPGARAATVMVRLLGLHGKSYVATLYERAHHRDYLAVDGLVPPGPVAAVIRSNRPIVAGRTMIFNGGKGLSTTVGVALASSQ